MAQSPNTQRIAELLARGESFTYENSSVKSEYGYPSSFTRDFITWQSLVRSTIGSMFTGGQQPARIVEEALAVPVIGNGRDKFEQMHGMMLGALEAARNAAEQEQSKSSAANSPAVSARARGDNKVFVVHGHDEGSKNELEIVLKDLGLEPVVLHRLADQGRTIIEKFEQHSDVGYAIVLLTPDDIAYAATEDVLADGARNKEWRARQNVVFELGFFFGSLGRERVCCLYKAPLTSPSDISGIVYKRFERSVEEVAYSLMRELRTAGFHIA